MQITDETYTDYCSLAETNNDNWRPPGNTTDQKKLVETKSDH